MSHNKRKQEKRLKRSHLTKFQRGQLSEGKALQAQATELASMKKRRERDLETARKLGLLEPEPRRGE